AAVAVVEIHPDRRALRGQDDQPVRPGAHPAVADGADPLWRPLVRRRAAAVQHDEIVARAGHLEERDHHSLPTIERSRSHQTIQTPSPTMRLFILLWPSPRSTKTIGTSASRIPFFHARKLISIWKA